MPVIINTAAYGRDQIAVSPQDTGWVNLQTFTADAPGSPPGSFLPWLNPTLAVTQNGVGPHSIAFLNFFSAYLRATNLNTPAIPPTSTIDGIRVRYLPREATSNGRSYESSVRLVVGGVVSGAERGIFPTRWPDYFVAYFTRGSSTDLWGLAPTAADINASNFGFVVSGFHDDGSGPLGLTIPVIDHMQMRINYTA